MRDDTAELVAAVFSDQKIGARKIWRERERSAAEQALFDLADDMRADPAFAHIAENLCNARALGFDPRDPDIIRRAIEAGRKQLADETSVLATVHPRVWGRRHPSVVYYMRHGTSVKIGTSVQVLSRRSSVGAESIMAIEFGDFAKEAERHDQFADIRLHGEWFRLTPDLGRHIADVRESFMSETGLSVEAWLDELRSHVLNARRPTERAASHIASPGMVTAREAAIATGVTRAAVYRWVAIGKLTPVNDVVRGRLFRLDDVLAAARSAARTPHSRRRLQPG